MLSYDFAETCVFDKQSPGPGHCGPLFRGHPFSRSYGVILPSSLERVISRPLVYSTYPPVSVYGTGIFCYIVVRAFLGSMIGSSYIFKEYVRIIPQLKDSFSSTFQHLENFRRNPISTNIYLLRPSVPNKK